MTSVDRNVPDGLSFLDFAFAAADPSDGPLDFIYVIYLKGEHSIKTLMAGAGRAFSAYPKSAQRLRDFKWIPDEREWVIEERNLVLDRDIEQAISELIRQPIDIQNERGIRQCLLRLGKTCVLVTHMHHATGDGLSLFFWLQAQLNEGQALISPHLMLKTKNKSVRKSIYAFGRPSNRLRFACAREPQFQRNWASILIDRAPLIGFELPFTYSALLSAVFLRTASEWNRRTGPDRSQRISLWIPINIRKDPFCGFGNGASRIRVYDRYPQDIPFAELALKVGEQIQSSKQLGEWSIPEFAEKLTRLPRWISVSLLRAYANRPRVDMGSLFFSHMERFPGSERFFERIEAIDMIAPIHKMHPISIVAVGLGPHSTRVTWTWDSSIVTNDEIQALMKLAQCNLTTAIREISASALTLSE